MLLVGIRPPAQFAATSQNPDTLEIQVLAIVPVAKLNAFEKVFAVPPSPFVSMLAKLPDRQPSAVHDRTV